MGRQGITLDRLKAIAGEEIEKGLFPSDESIARKAGITYRSYQNAKAGCRVSIDTASKIAKALHRKLPELQSAEAASQV